MGSDFGRALSHGFALRSLLVGRKCTHMQLDSLQLGSLKSILIVKPSSLGDIVHTLPVLALLRRYAPRARIDWLVNHAWAPILVGHPLLDGLIEFPRNQFRGLPGMLRLAGWARRLGGHRPELALDVQGLLRSAILGRGCKPRKFVGYSDAREGAHWFYDAAADVAQKRSPHAVDRYLSFFTNLGLELPETAEFPLPEGDRPAGADELPGRFVLLHPFSRGQGKSLGFGQVEALCERWGEVPVILAGKADTPELRLPENCVNLLNRTTLAELIWLLRRASWVVSVDSGPMHLAAAVTPNLVSLHTWTDPLKVGPYRHDAWVWKSGEITAMAEYRASRASIGETRDRGFPDDGLEALGNFVLGRF